MCTIFFSCVCIKALLNGGDIPVYGKGEQIRDWIHVKDHCNAIDILAKALANSTLEHSIYNIGSDNELSNLDIATKICKIVGIDPDDGITFVEDPRGNAHDFRYAIDSGRMEREFGWTAENTHPFAVSMMETINWYSKNVEGQ